jgi:hypothetical protein
MEIFLIIIFALVSVFALIVQTVIFHHFKKFSLPGDPFPSKILIFAKWGVVFLLFLSFVFLILLII